MGGSTESRFETEFGDKGSWWAKWAEGTIPRAESKANAYGKDIFGCTLEK